MLRRLSRSQLQSISAWRVCWRGSAVRLPPVSKRKRSSSRAAIPSTERGAGGRGQPERQRDAVQPTDNLGYGRDILRVRTKSGRIARARATKS